MENKYTLQLLIGNHVISYKENDVVKHFTLEERTNFIIPKECKQIYPGYIYRWVEVPIETEYFEVNFHHNKGYSINKVLRTHKPYCGFSTIEEAKLFITKEIQYQKEETEKYFKAIKRLEIELETKRSKYYKFIQQDKLFEQKFNEGLLEFSLPKNLIVKY